MYGFSNGNEPGFRDARESMEVEVLRFGMDGQTLASVFPGAIIGSATVDAGNTPTTTLRGGLALGYTDSGGELQLYGAPSTDDGRNQFVGILPHAQDMLTEGTAADKIVNVLKGGLLRSDVLLGLDPHAKAVMARMGFQFDGLVPEGAAFLVHEKRTIYKADNFTVLASQNGCLFVQTGAAKTFTLPTLEHGLCYEFVNAGSGTMIIAATGKLMFGGSLVANSVTNAASGGHCRVRGVYTDGSTLKWMVETTGSWS